MGAAREYGQEQVMWLIMPRGFVPQEEEEPEDDELGEVSNPLRL